ncbi:hypothetical protein RND71_003824 [Anisodus tanguticus]|uniref:Uncharacterized protein n=1 Tax=Anisodus tanguticus TaxID=243964 RepID=A0AAE1VP24_9SOLA|nr:hypothetical protein RND71_003824 [Anisodus tanguticus]
MLIEREIFGKEALNVIACEGLERVERPQTYKQWQVRNLRAMFTQIPFEREIMNSAIEKMIRRNEESENILGKDDEVE